jgi:S1-C subfamily serine protease
MSNDRRYGFNEDDDRSAGETPGRGHRRPSARGLSPAVVFLLVALGILAGAAAFWAGGRLLQRARVDPNLNDPNAKLREATPTGPRDAEERGDGDLFKKVEPSVVNVDIVQLRRTGWDDRPSFQQTGAGSGFIWDDDGRIVTNYHVIADVTRRPNTTVRVVLYDGSAYEAVLVGAAPDH